MLFHPLSSHWHIQSINLAVEDGRSFSPNITNRLFKRAMSMAWRCSGTSNTELIENLSRSGLIKNERVKQAMLGVSRLPDQSSSKDIVDFLGEPRETRSLYLKFPLLGDIYRTEN